MLTNKVVRQNLGDNIVIGVQGDAAFLYSWDIIIHNYEITTGKIKWMEPSFFYFITTHKRLEDSLSLCHQNQLAVSGELKKLGIAQDGGWIIARKHAREQIATFEAENFYVRMSVNKGKFDGTFSSGRIK